MYAIKFREERLLFPLVQEIIPEDVLDSLFGESLEIRFPFYQPEIISENVKAVNLEEYLVLRSLWYFQPVQYHLFISIVFVCQTLNGFVGNQVIDCFANGGITKVQRTGIVFVAVF